MNSLCRLLCVCACALFLNFYSTSSLAASESSAPPTDSSAAYNAWQQNRPHEALPILHKKAQASQAWYDFYDLGLAAHDAGDRGAASIWLLQAHQLAADQTLPLDALRAMNINIPAGYLQDLGPLAWPGTGIAGFISMCLIGFCIIIAITFSSPRYWCLIIAAVLLIISLPGLIAYSLDSQRILLATATETPLLDSSGHSLQILPTATVVRVIRQQQDSRVLVLLNNGVRGYLNNSDCQTALDLGK